ncbi:MAG: hypothetical protein LBU67_03935 [Oscillospiraceae bacterium]|jgi:hypothetical protein|nr:hypothetical protein [Oscillospiraceae bacterium]
MKRYFVGTLAALLATTALVAVALSFFVNPADHQLPGEEDAHKAFYLGGNAPQRFRRLLSTGEPTSCKFNVTNVDSGKRAMDADMDLTINTDCMEALIGMPDLQVRLVEYLPDSSVRELATTQARYGVLSYVRERAFLAGRPQTLAFGLVLTRDMEADDTDAARMPVDIKVQVAGTPHVVVEDE